MQCGSSLMKHYKEARKTEKIFTAISKVMLANHFIQPTNFQTPTRKGMDSANFFFVPNSWNFKYGVLPKPGSRNLEWFSTFLLLKLEVTKCSLWPITETHSWETKIYIFPCLWSKFNRKDRTTENWRSVLSLSLPCYRNFGRNSQNFKNFL